LQQPGSALFRRPAAIGDCQFVGCLWRWRQRRVGGGWWRRWLHQPNTATLAWDAVTAPNLQGYRVYYRTAAGTYQPVAQGQPVGNGTTTYQLTNLSSQTTYFMVVTAYDSQGNESGYSNVVSKTIP